MQVNAKSVGLGVLCGAALMLLMGQSPAPATPRYQISAASYQQDGQSRFRLYVLDMRNNNVTIYQSVGGPHTRLSTFKLEE